MNPAATKHISAKSVNKLCTTSARGKGKKGFPFWLCLGEAEGTVSRLASIDGNKVLGPGGKGALSLIAELAASDVKGKGKKGFPFWLSQGQGLKRTPGFPLGDGKKALSSFSVKSIPAKLVSKLTTGAGKGNGKTTWPSRLFLGEPQSTVSAVALNEGDPVAKFVAALRQLGLPLNSLQLPSDALPHLRSLLVSHGMSEEQVARLLNHCASEDGAIEVDKLVVPLLTVSELQTPAEEGVVIRAEQRTELEALLSELQLAPEQIRRLVETAVTSTGDLDVEDLVEWLKKVEPRLSTDQFVEICRKRGIKVQPQEPRIENHKVQSPPETKKPEVNAASTAKRLSAKVPSSAPKPSSLAASGGTEVGNEAGLEAVTNDPNLSDFLEATSAGSEVDASDLSPTLGVNDRLEIAARLRRAGVRPEQVKRLLERTAANTQPVEQMQSEVEGQNLKTDQNIQTLLAKLEPRTSNPQTKNGQLARPGKDMPEPFMRAVSEAATGPTGKAQAAAEATEAAATVVESQQKIQEALSNELRANRLRLAVETERTAKPVAGKGTVSNAVASVAAENTAGARAQAMSPSTGPSPQSPTPAMETQFQVAQRFVTMSRNGESRTRLNLHPPELGQIQIEISLESNRLSAILVTETQVVKELMEAHLGQLRQHLAQHSLHLEDFQVSVGADASTYKESNPGHFGSGGQSGQGDASETIAAEVEHELRVADQSHLLDGSGRIDLFA